MWYYYTNLCIAINMAYHFVQGKIEFAIIYPKYMYSTFLYVAYTVYVHVHTYIHTYILSCTFAHILYVHTYMYIRIYVHTVCTYIHTCKFAYIYVRYVHMYVCMYSIELVFVLKYLFRSANGPETTDKLNPPTTSLTPLQ